MLHQNKVNATILKIAEHKFIFAFLAIQFGIAALSLSGTAAHFSNWQIDKEQQLLFVFTKTAETSHKIVVVGLDEESLADFKVPVATLHAQLGQFLEAMAIAEPLAVGIDMVLPEMSYDSMQPGLDAALARGVAKLRLTTPLAIGIGAYADGTPRRIHPPFKTLLGPDRLGWAFAIKDADGVVRRFSEAFGEGGQSVPTLTGQLARQLNWPVYEGILPFYLGPRMGFVPLREVLAWKASGDVSRLKTAFEGSVVMLGSVLSHDDQHLVPIPLAVTDRSNTSHGVYVLAHHLRALGSGSLVHELPFWVHFVVGVLMTFSWWLRPSKTAWILVGLVSLGMGAASISLFWQGWAIPAIYWALALFIGLAGRTLWRMAEVVIERRRLRQSFEGSVSPPVLKEILAGRLTPQASGEKLDICVLFSDIRGFTTLSEKMLPEDATDLLNRYFVSMSAVIHQNDGTLDKFIGDGIMAIFGSPQRLDNPCQSAFNAAVAMFKALDEFNETQFARGGPQLRMGVGLHYGPVFVGYIGSSTRNSYSAIGDTVNVASRLEQLTKSLGCSLVFSNAVQQRLLNDMGAKPMGEHLLNGRKAMEVYSWTTGQWSNSNGCS